MPCVLVVEDDPTDLRLIQSVLASLKLTPQPATSEAELERALELGGFDLVIADHRLGFGEGLWVAQRVQEHRPGVPIVLLAPSDVQLVPHRETPGSRILPCPKDAAHLEEAVKKALRASKEATWLAENPVGLLRLDPQGRILEVNPAAARMLGYPVSALRQRPLAELCPNPQAVHDLLARLKASPGIVRGQLTLRSQEGTALTVSAQARTLAHPQGGVQGYELSLVDISAYVQLEERFRALVENSRELIYVLDAEGYMVYASPNVDQVLDYDPMGYAKEHLHILSFVHPEDRTYAEAALEDLLRHPGATREYQVRILDGQGRQRVVRVWGRNLLENPAVRGIVLNVQDVTREVELQSTLDAQRRLFQNLLETLPGVPWQAQVDPGGDPMRAPLLYLGPQAARSGFPLKELFADPEAYLLHLHPDDLSPLEQALRRALTEPGSVQEAIYRFRQNDGSERWRWVKNSFVYDPHTHRLSGYIQDITQEVEAEATRRLLQQALEAAHETVVLTDREGQIKWVNPAFTRLTGYAQEEAIGKNPRILKSGVQDQAFYKNLWDTILSGQVWEGELVNRRKDGTLYTERMTITPVRENGEIRHFIAIKRDVTEEKARERALRESEALFRTLAETAPAFILLWQEERLTFANQEALRLTGYTPEELQNRPIWEFVHPADRERVQQRGLARLRGEAPPSRYTFRIVTKGGEVRWLDYSGARVELGGKPAILGVALDITEAKERELSLEAFARVSLALRQSENLQEMMHHALEAILAVMEAPAGSILLYDQETGRLEEAASQGWLRAIPTPPTLNEESMVARAFRGEVVVSQDLKKDPRVRPTARDLVPEGFSGVVVPLLAGQEPIGALTLAWAHPRIPTPGDVNRALLVAEVISNAVRRASLRQKLAKRVEHLEALRAIDQAIAGALELAPTLEIFLNQVMRLPLDAAALFLYEPTDKVLELKALRGFLTPKKAVPQRLLLGQGHIGQAALRGQVVHVADLRQDPGAAPEFTRQEGLVTERVYPLLAKGKLLGALAVFTRKPWDLSPEDEEFLETLATQGTIALDNARTFQELLKSQRELEAAYDLTLWGWAKAVELRDQETAGHTERVTELTLRLARALGVPEEDLDDIRRGAILHDVGKIGIPDAILLKPGPLTEEEWAIMKKHPVYAYEWLSGIPFLKKALEIPYAHHERWDGSGYPRGLKGLEIPLAARIFAVVDVYDALTSDRPYRKAWPKEKALAYLQEQGGKQLDPEVVAAFLRLIQEASEP